MNQTLQLQRLAHEELGYGIWTHAADSIPTTRRGEKLSLIDTSDPDHPRLVTPTPADHTSTQESETKPDQDDKTTQSGGHPTPLDPAPVNDVLSTGQVLQTASVNGNEEVGRSSSSWDEVDVLRVAENHETGNTSFNSTEDDTPPTSEDPVLQGSVPSPSLTV